MRGARPARGARYLVAALALLLAAALPLDLQTQPHVAAATSLTFTPIADAYTTSDSPTTNFGTSKYLKADASPVKESYLEFALAGIDGPVMSAKLRLYCTQDPSKVGGSIASMSDTTWSESTVTYDTRPAIDGPVLATLGPVSVGQWYEVDVTAAITGNGTVSLGLFSTSSDGAWYASRETGSTAPVLLVTFESASTPTPTPTASPTPEPSGDPILMAAGDIACKIESSSYNGGNGTKSACQMRATSDLLVNGSPSAVIALGDNQYEAGELYEFQQSYDPSWGRVKGVTHPAVGNHEYLTTGAAGYYTYFGAAASPLDANCTSGCKGYYSFDLPNKWHVVILNVQCSKVGGCGSGTPQEVWLRNDLAAHQGWHIIAAWHQPRWSSGYGGDIKNSATFWKDLYSAHADIVLTGHSHNYERWALMDPNGNPDPNGIREFVVGTGGNNHTTLSCGKPGQPTCRPTSEARDDTTFGVLKLTLHEHSYDWVFIPDTQAGNGSFTDSGSQATHS